MIAIICYRFKRAKRTFGDRASQTVVMITSMPPSSQKVSFCRWCQNRSGDRQTAGQFLLSFGDAYFFKRYKTN